MLQEAKQQVNPKLYEMMQASRHYMQNKGKRSVVVEASFCAMLFPMASFFVEAKHFSFDFSESEKSFENSMPL